MNEYKSPSDIYIGQLLNNRYLLREIIGSGGMGKVYLAEDVTKDCVLVAIKMLSLNIKQQNLAKRFGREIFIGAQLGRKSNHIIRVFSYGITDEKIPFYVMQYLQGRNLKQILKIESFDILRSLNICEQICLGLDCAHQGIILKGKVYPVLHRDIKPENIFLYKDSQTTEIVKILDFGIAKFLTENSGMTMTDSFIGSLPYSSPENMQGNKILDVRSDIYSLGILMFEMITGRHPFYTTSHSFGTWSRLHCVEAPPTFEEVNPHIQAPRELQQLVMRCLAKDLQDRPKNVKEILDDIVKIKAYIEQSNQPENSNIETNHSQQLVPFTYISEQEYWNKHWPKNKPISLICFPQILHTSKGNIPSLWAMLPAAEIQEFKNKKHAIKFISNIQNYPMILWVTILYNEENKLIRWLSYYLDIKDHREEKMLRTLSSVGYYHILFFTHEHPHKCNHVMTLVLSAKQRQYISDAINFSKRNSPSVSYDQAKVILKAEYEKFRKKVNEKMNIKTKTTSFSIKSWFSQIFKFWKHE